MPHNRIKQNTVIARREAPWRSRAVRLFLPPWIASLRSQ